MWSSTLRSSRRGAMSVLLGSLVLAVGCGSDAAELRVDDSVRVSAATAVPESTVVAAPADGVAGVVVDVGQGRGPDHRWWWVVDLTGSSTIDGSSRVLVEVASEELGCGDEHHPIDAFQVQTGEAVSFEVGDVQPGAPPMFYGGTDIGSAVAVTGRRFRIACPTGSDEVATVLATQRSIWESAGVDSYEFAMTWQQFNLLAGAYRITVVDGQVVRLVRDGEVELDPDRLDGQLPRTIDELFDYLEGEVSADEFTASYDPELGYPTAVLVDEIVEGVDDELEVRVTELTIGAAPARAAADEAQPGDRIEATPIDWFTSSPDPTSEWLLVDAADGVTVDGSSRLVVQVDRGEVRCGAELRAVDTLASLEGGETVSFELVATEAAASPNDTPMWAAGVPVTGRQLHIPGCPATMDDLLATLAEARARWEAAGIDTYDFVISWSSMRPAPTTYQVTVVGGQTTAVVPFLAGGDPALPTVDQAVLDQVPGTIDEVFDRLEGEILAEGAMASYHSDLGYPDWVNTADHQIGIAQFNHDAGGP